MTVTVEVTGVKEASQYLRNISVGVKNASAEGVKRTALEVNNHAKRLCPVDTGRLRSSINIMKMDLSEPSATVGTNVEYAEYVEFGTSRQSAQPYMRPAASEGQKVLKKVTEQEIKNKIK